MVESKKILTKTYRPRTNGQLERFSRTILNALRHYVAENQKDWDEYSAGIAYGYNSEVHWSTGYPPFELVLSRFPTHFAVEKETIDALQDAQ